jgi:hypothetical protein
MNIAKLSVSLQLCDIYWLLLITNFDFSIADTHHVIDSSL